MRRKLESFYRGRIRRGVCRRGLRSAHARNPCRTGSTRTTLRALFLEDNLSFLDGQFLPAESTSYVAQWCWRGQGRAEFPEWAFPLCVGIVSAANQWAFRGQSMQVGVFGVVRNYGHVGLAGDDGPVLSKRGCGGNEDEQRKNCDFHRLSFQSTGREARPVPRRRPLSFESYRTF